MRFFDKNDMGILVGRMQGCVCLPLKPTYILYTTWLQVFWVTHLRLPLDQHDKDTL